MAGAAGSGFLSGFTQTSQALQKLQYDRDKDEQELALKKEDLALRRDLLKGQEASRKLTDQTHQLTIEKFLREQGERLRATALLGQAGQPAQPGGDQAAVPLMPNGQAVPTTTTGVPQAPILGSTPPITPAASGASPEIRQAIIAEAQRQGVDPALALSVAHVESGFRNVPGDGGKAQGFFQLHAPAAQDAGIDPAQRSDPAQNIKGGVTYLKLKLAQANGDPLKAVELYNGGGDPQYGAKVQDAYKQYAGNSTGIVLAPNDPILAKTRAAMGGLTPDQAAQFLQGRVTATMRNAHDAAFLRELAATQQVYGELFGKQAAGADAPLNAASPLVRQPVGLPESPELTRLNTRIATLDASQQQIEALLQKSPDLRTEPRVKEQLDSLRKDRSELERQRTELVKEQTPSGLLQAYTKQYGLAEGTRRFEAQQREEKLAVSRAQGADAAALAAEKAAQVEKGKTEEELRQREQKTLLQVNAQTSRQYFDTTTGKPLPQNSKQKDVDTRLGTDVVFLDDQEAKDYRQVQKLLPLIVQQGELLQKVYGPGGVFEKLKPEDRLAATVEGGLGKLLQSGKYTDLVQLDRQLRGNIDAIGKGLKAQVGTQTEQDASRMASLLPKVDGVPDSQAVAYETYNFLVDTLNRMQGYYLGNGQFKHAALQPLGNTVTPAQLDQQTDDFFKKYRKP